MDFLFALGSSLPGATLKSSGCNVFDTEAITAMDISRKEPSFIAVAGRKSKCSTVLY
jgi:outer membrane biosynthesis protein TonB